MTPLVAGDRFPNLRLAGVQGRVELRDRWRDGPLVVTFMRHFGCAFCREHLIQISRAFEDLSAAGADVVAIFQYNAQASREFCASRGVPFDCVGDPLRQAYAEVSLGRGNRKQLLSWQVARHFARQTTCPTGRPSEPPRSALPGQTACATGEPERAGRGAARRPTSHRVRSSAEHGRLR